MKATATGHWKSVLKNMDRAELFALEEGVKELEANPAWQQMVKLIEAGREAVLGSLTQASSTPEYGDMSRALGHIAGLEEAPNIVQAILETAQARRKELERAIEIQKQEQEGDPQ